MEQHIVLMKLLGVAGEIRQKQRRNAPHTKKRDEHREREGHRHRDHHHKMTPVAQTALYLLLEKGSLNQRTLAKSLNVTGQAVSELIKKLEAKELITKTHGELNNENIISLTEKGRHKGEEIHQQTMEMSTTLFTDFTQEEVDTLYALLEKLEKVHTQ